MTCTTPCPEYNPLKMSLGNDGSDLVGNYHECAFTYPSNNGAACDYNYDSADADNSDNNGFYELSDRTFYVGWSNPVLIRSIRIFTTPSGGSCRANIYVTMSKIFLI